MALGDGMLPDDPLVPPASRLPLYPPGGRVAPNREPPGPPRTRPFGMGYAISASVVEAAGDKDGKHSRKPTRKTVTKATHETVTRDGAGEGYEPDSYTEVVYD